jgi:pimeloyl-ACP methyl ester carboxylesterase
MTREQGTLHTMSPRPLLLLVLTLTLAAAAPSQAKYVALPGAPGYGPAKYAKVYVDKTGPASAKNVLVLIPGTFGGSGDFTLVAKALVERVPNLQVWAIDRRSNALEDTSYMVKALKGEITGQQLFDYYLGWLGNDKIEPHYQPIPNEDVRFAKRWGLKLAMEDTRRVIRAARRGGRRVILGGHSLGASSVYDYATWDFAGRPGYRDLIGMVAIDGGGMGAATKLADAKQTMKDFKEQPSPWLDLLKLGLPWVSGIFQETGGIGAKLEPDAPSVGQASPLLPAQFKPGVPVTNKAQFGYAFDYRTSPAALALIHIHSGHINENDAEPHGWVDDGITPLENLIALAAQEPGNFVEWYYPQRLTIDVRAASSLRKDAATRYLGLRTWHAKDVDRPLYAFQTSLGAGRVLAGAKVFQKYSSVPYATYVDASKGYSHLDPLTADPKRNDFIKTVVPFLRRVMRKA